MVNKKQKQFIIAEIWSDISCYIVKAKTKEQALKLFNKGYKTGVVEDIDKSLVDDIETIVKCPKTKIAAIFQSESYDAEDK